MIVYINIYLFLYNYFVLVAVDFAFATNFIEHFCFLLKHYESV